MDNKVLYVYNWPGYIASDVPERFTKKTGIKVVYDVYDSNEVLEVELLAGESGYDMVVPSNPFLAKQTKAGVYQKLDRSKLPSRKNLNKNLVHTLEANDPGNEHMIPYMWGTIGIGYNPDKVKTTFDDNAPVDSWNLVSRPENTRKLRQCGASFLDLPTEILPAALYYLGHKLDTDNPKELKAAEKLSLKVRPYVTYFYLSKHISDLTNGNICVVIGYSGDIYQVKPHTEEAKNRVTVKYNILKEGAGSFFGMAAIPKDTENTEGTLASVNFLMRPGIVAEITSVVQSPNGDAVVIPLAPGVTCNNPDIYPSEEVMKKLYTSLDLLIEAQWVMIHNWIKIKSGK